MAGFIVNCNFRFQTTLCVVGQFRGRSVLAFRFAPLLSPPIPATAYAPTLAATSAGQLSTTMKISKTIWIITLVLFSALTYFALTNRKIDINTLQNKIVDFRELPPIVADMFRNTKKYRTRGHFEAIQTTD